jgi:hypothetical protein
VYEVVLTVIDCEKKKIKHQNPRITTFSSVDNLVATKNKIYKKNILVFDMLFNYLIISVVKVLCFSI